MKSQYILLILLVFTFKITNAQFSFTSRKSAEKIKESVLLVAFEEKDTKKTAKLAKRSSETLKHYQQQIEGRNYALKNAIQNFWDFSEKIEYKPASEAQELITKNKDKYVMIKFGQHLDYERLKTGQGLDGKPAGWRRTAAGLAYNPSTKYTSLANEITTLEIKDAKSYIKVFLPNVYPSKADVVYGVQELQYILKYLMADPDNKITNFMKHIKQNASQLKNLILLVDKNEVNPKLNETSIKAVYPYPFKLVEDEVIDEAIIAEDPKYAYVQIVNTPSGKGNVSTHTIVGAEDGKIYCYVSPRVAVGIKGTSIIKYNDRIKSKHFAKYAENIKP